VAEHTRQIHKMIIPEHVVAEHTRQIHKMIKLGHVVAENCATGCSWSAQ
jgi:hypothetical protein